MKGLAMLLFVLAIIAINVIVGGLATQYVIEFWGTFIKGIPVHIPFFPCAVGGLFLGEITIPAAIITWIISFII